MAYKWPNKDPDETLDYSVDWSRYLDGANINSYRWFCEDSDGTKTLFSGGGTINGLTHGGAAFDTYVVTITLSGGTNNTTYALYNEITSTSGITTERKINLKVRQRT